MWGVGPDVAPDGMSLASVLLQFSVTSFNDLDLNQHCVEIKVLCMGFGYFPSIFNYSIIFTCVYGWKNPNTAPIG